MLLTGCFSSDENQNAAEKPVLVKTYPISEASLPSRTFPGALSATRSADLAFEVGGVVEEIFVQVGDRVTAGQALAKLDPRDYQSRLLAARAEAERAAADAERGRLLLEQNAMAPARVEALRALADATAASLAQAEKAVEDTTLRAPFDGLVAAKFFDGFASLAPKTLAFRIHDLSAFSVAIDLPQTLVLAVQRRIGSDAAARGEAVFTAHFNDSIASETTGLPLTIRSFSTDPDPRTGTYQFKLNLPAPDDLRLLPGMTCTVRVTLKTGAGEAVTVPPSAVGTDAAGKPLAWVINAEGRAEARSITVGALTEAGLVVAEGLNPGDTVITTGLNQLTPGKLVKPF